MKQAPKSQCRANTGDDLSLSCVLGSLHDIDHLSPNRTTYRQPKQIILFASYAYGHPHQTSDVDLLVVMDTALRETAQAVRIGQALECHFGVDLIVRTPAKLTQRVG